ncbi:hypothetical protein E1B28_003376 [Marasmius oreades]|uniref:Uncharacterized protein n=1 Tax=Marasmius oreades TaxID=181124 RepID=A0A9P7RLP0_9AGAR|nr:uncharacterized protein E1B28_003376 [Marasmius oreades]KAG7085839.1 hypothetical protein E1B28_003376 [Marasmius oreades]
MSVATLQAFGEQLPLDNTIGAMLIGVITSAVLYGVSLGQTLYYFNRYPKDPWYLKWLVGSTLFFDTLHLALISHSVYHYTIIEYYNHHALENVVWSVLAELIPNGLTATFVQLFYVSRVFRLSKKNYWLTGIILVLVLAYAAGGVGKFLFPSLYVILRTLLRLRSQPGPS